MASYKVLIKRSAEKEIRALPRHVKVRVLVAIGSLRTTPRPQGAEKLSARDAYRIRVGSYRIIYTIEDRILTIEVIKVGHRRQVYR